MSPHPPIPQKIKPFQHEKERKTRQEWERYLQQQIKNFQKAERRNNNEGMLNAYDLAGAMLRRRISAILNSMPTIYERYQTLTDATPNALGEEWISLNTALCSYSYEEAQSHILFAAALWILDHIDVAEAFPYLPKDDSPLEEVYGPNLWDTQHDYDLILSVQYVLENRNGPPENNGHGYLRVITDAKNAEGALPVEEKHRQDYEALLSLLPKEEIKRAVTQFEELFWQWTDQYFFGFKELAAVTDMHRREYDALCLQFNSLVDDLTIAVKEMEKEEKDRKRAKKPTPLMVMAQQPKPFPLPNTGAMMDYIPQSGQRIAVIAQKMLNKQESMDAVFAKYSEGTDKEQAYVSSQVRPGGGTPLPLDGVDPYALCFALLYLSDTGSDLPWLYGPSVMLTEQIVERLPWGIIEYDEDEDAVWWGEETPYIGKSAQLPDWYERKYQKKDDYFPRSLVQLLYEETGCLMPRDLHLYDRRAKELGRYGLRGKDAQMMLTMMAALSNAKYQNSAVNLKPWEDETEQQEEIEQGESNQELKAEIRKLKNALHDADKSVRSMQQELEAAKKQAAQDTRELADLRSIVFSAEQNDEQDEDQAPVEEQKLDLPYSVIKETLVFGGHDTWVKAIKPMLKGNIRFVDRDYVFDAAIIRRAEAIWIQTNSISHKQYYRIVDNARLYKKPIRYFGNASAMKCAEQLIENDR